jgi:hypothetical protein
LATVVVLATVAVAVEPGVPVLHPASANKRYRLQNAENARKCLGCIVESSKSVTKEISVLGPAEDRWMQSETAQIDETRCPRTTQSTLSFRKIIRSLAPGFFTAAGSGSPVEKPPLIF